MHKQEKSIKFGYTEAIRPFIGAFLIALIDTKSSFSCFWQVSLNVIGSEQYVAYVAMPKIIIYAKFRDPTLSNKNVFNTRT